jgi:hypothetical protein
MPSPVSKCSFGSAKKALFENISLDEKLIDCRWKIKQKSMVDGHYTGCPGPQWWYWIQRVFLQCRHVISPTVHAIQYENLICIKTPSLWAECFCSFGGSIPIAMITKYSVGEGRSPCLSLCSFFWCHLLIYYPKSITQCQKMHLHDTVAHSDPRHVTRMFPYSSEWDSPMYEYSL